MPYRLQSYTLPQERDNWLPLSADDVVVWGTPVYAGRVPNKTIDFVRSHIIADGPKGICVAVFGNRHYDNALAEMVDVMQQGGIRPVAAAAVVSRHVFSPNTIAVGRPTEDEFVAIDQWCDMIDLDKAESVHVPGNGSGAYYTPLGAQGRPAKFLKAMPRVDGLSCDGCGLCSQVCPMGSVRMADSVPVFEGICIKCQACVLDCPQQALSFADADFLSHKEMLELHCSRPADCAFFL